MWSILAVPESDGIGQCWEATRATGSAAGKAGDRLCLSPENNQEHPFWLKKRDKSQGFGGGAPNQRRRAAASLQGSSVLFELRRRSIAESGVQPFLVIDKL